MLPRRGPPEDDDDDGCRTLSPSVLPASSSPTASPPAPPSLAEASRTLRESTRPPDVLPAPVDPRSRGHRKAAPSPLQSGQNAAAASSGPAASQRPRSPPFSHPLYHEEPRSPREKLDALLAEEERHRSPPAPAAATPTPSTVHTSPPAPPNFGSRGATQPTKPSAYAQLRNVSAPILSSAGSSPSSSPVTMPAPSRPNRPDIRPAPARNHSIDSAASSLSSSASQSWRANPGHIHTLSHDGTSPGNPPDMAALIAAAGSPEAAVAAMWREKQSASSHNAKLWKLVEKQRTMILGLNKDLERALKDKDRYRQKMREYANHVPPIPSVPQRSDTFDSAVERDESQSPAPSEKQEESFQANTALKPVEHKTSPLTQEPAVPHLIPDSQLAQSPSHSSEGQTASNPSSTVNSPTDYSIMPLHISNKAMGLDAIVNETVTSTGKQAHRPVTETILTGGLDARPATPDAHLEAPALSLTQATPVIGGDGFEAPPMKPAHPLRKAPPAPLNLAKPAKTSAHLYQPGPGEHDDSDYDDTLEADEIPTVERGRRKTREDDDRVREAMLTQEEGTRSKSKKKRSESQSKITGPTVEAPGGEHGSIAAGPASPREFSPRQTGLPLSPRHPPANSLNALLSPTNSDSSMMANRSIASPPLMSPPLMSPGLPSSPRPGDRPMGSPLPRNPKQGMTSPPMSPRSTVNGTPQQPTRAPRQPIPLPPNSPLSYVSPQVSRVDPPAQPKQQTQSSDLLKPPGAQPSPDSDGDYHGHADPAAPEHVYRGLVSDQYPGLLLPPNALPSIDVKVSSSRLRPSRMSFLAPKPQEEDPVFILAVYARSDGKQLWRMEKTIVALPALDAQLKSLCEFQGKLPDRALFSGHAPARIDARRVALNQYFAMILDTPMSERAAQLVCEFFSTDVIGAQNGDTLAPEQSVAPVPSAPKGKQMKEGYLTKRGKNFGGWKARYFTLEGPEFRYYEIAGGAHLGTIKLQNAQIGKQSQQQSNQSPQRRDDAEDNQYRHAFLILEPKRKDSSSLVRHVLCAESDEERDAWVEALLKHVDMPEASSSPVETQVPGSAHSGPSTKGPSQELSRSRGKESPDTDKGDRVQGLSYDDTIAAEAPIRGPTHREARAAHEARDAYAHSPKNSSFTADHSGHYPAISGPTNGAPIQNLESWGNKTLAPPTTVKDKKRSIFGFRGRGSNDLAPGQLGVQQQAPERVVQHNRSIFGIPLQEAVEYSQPIGVKIPLPAVVYRSLEYLVAKKAANEEGIFRLSGSNNVIKGLRDRFNIEGDVKLLDGQYYDVHAVASLLKLYLRELPSSILTRELHLDFLKVLDLDERKKKIQAFNVLVHKLPRTNHELLRSVSCFLIDIIENAAINKMTVRNVGIVFAPTLNIPAPLISFFLTDFPDIFGTPLDEAVSPIHEIQITTPPLGEEAVRSPRHQMFSDLPTPAYNETTFRHSEAPSSFPMASNVPQYSPPQPPPQQYQQQHPHQQQQHPHQQHQQQQQQQQQQYAGYDTGFIPVRPSYEAPGYEQKYQAQGYGSLDGAVQTTDAREQRQRRRESGMLLVNMGMGQQRKGSNPRIQNNPSGNPLMVREETAFE
ncbi:hypothetical protein BDV95DRAFT_228072 [Massariosphaeria phaeospora]|uniref:RhoGAP-domain-containing protein n=1 Tax=Massariosphaeria phaeospora TaxID=100035 RepID=A0A7C8IH75_9PLEO|nr:hypothetical protein BDV95DRAFT_228072 [Massariosphaeria phaeospora]